MSKESLTMKAPVMNAITFCGGTQTKEVMRISYDGITVSPDVHVDEAAKVVLDAMEKHIVAMVEARTGALRAEIDRLRADYNAARDAHDRRAAEVIELRAALREYACKCKNPHTGCAVEFDRSRNARCGWEARAALGDNHE